MLSAKVTPAQTSLNLFIKQPYSACVHETFFNLPLSKTNLSNVDSLLFSCGKAKLPALVFQEGSVFNKIKGKKSINKCNTTTIINRIGFKFKTLRTILSFLSLCVRVTLYLLRQLEAGLTWGSWWEVMWWSLLLGPKWVRSVLDWDDTWLELFFDMSVLLFLLGMATHHWVCSEKKYSQLKMKPTEQFFLRCCLLCC